MSGKVVPLAEAPADAQPSRPLKLRAALEKIVGSGNAAERESTTARSQVANGTIAAKVSRETVSVLARAKSELLRSTLDRDDKDALLWTFFGTETRQVPVDKAVLFIELLLDIDRPFEDRTLHQILHKAAQEFTDGEGMLDPSSYADFLHHIAHQHRELHLELLKTEHISTLHLLKEFADIGEPDRPKSLSIMDFITCVMAFNTLPFWILFRSWFLNYVGPAGRPVEARRFRTREMFYMVHLHQINKIYLTLGKGMADRWGRRIDLWILPLLTALQFICMYVPIACFIIDASKVWGDATSLQNFMEIMNPAAYCTFWQSILGLGAFMFLMMAGCLKIAAHDGPAIITMALRLRDLGNLDAPILNQAPPQDGKYGKQWTVHGMLLRINDEARIRMSTTMINANREAAMWAVFIEVFHFGARRLIVGNWAPSSPLGIPMVTFVTVALVYNLYFAFRDVPEVVQYIRSLKLKADVFCMLFDRIDAMVVDVPLLNNRKPFNMILWQRTRQWMQMPNPVQIRWVEGHIICMVTAAVAVAVLLLVTLIQGLLFKSPDQAGDTQLFLAWVIVAFAYLIMGANKDVFTAVAMGTQYLEDIGRLGIEVYTIECETQVPELRGERGDGFVPSQQELQECKELMLCLVRLISDSGEFIKLYGIPLNKAFRNAIVSFLFTAAAAGISAGLSLVIKRATSS